MFQIIAINENPDKITCKHQNYIRVLGLIWNWSLAVAELFKLILVNCALHVNVDFLYSQSAVQQLFHGSNQSISTKDQICTIVRLVTTTIHQIHAVFYGLEENQTDSNNQSSKYNSLQQSPINELLIIWPLTVAT